MKRRKRGGRKLKEGLSLPDENDDVAASVSDISRKNTRPGSGVIRKQSREFRIRNEEDKLRLNS